MSASPMSRSEGRSRRRILVRTFPPNLNPNYGGILQAWALKTVLEREGYDVYVDSTRTDMLPTLRARALKVGKRIGARHVPSWMLPQSLGLRLAESQMNRPLLEFSQEEIQTVALYDRKGRARPEVVAAFDAYVVGSDQVWRPRYVDVPTYLLDFVPDGFRGPRVSYAASFGSDAPEFTADLIARTATLAQKLTSISVRESSGRDLCMQLWGRDAVHVADPTLLLEPQDYVALVGDGAAVATGELVTYVLDSSESARRAAESAATSLGTGIRSIRPPSASSIQEFRSNPAKFMKPSVQDWISLIETADYVVTDSFHGCMFAILFERPFLVVPNATRGRSRFESALGTLGLEDRMAAFDENLGARMADPIDWARTRERLLAFRRASRDFLDAALADLSLPRQVVPEP